MLERSHDAAFLNRVLNHPSVQPHVLMGTAPPLDVSPAVHDERNYFLANEWGGFLFVAREQYVYEVHTQFLPEGRGRKALKAARFAADWMFTKTDALRIDTFVQRGNVAADALTRAAGFSCWGDVEVLGKPCVYYALPIKKWARSLNLCRLLQS